MAFPKRSKIKELVSMTGFSVATVSRALNEDTAYMVKAPTREKVCRVAEKLNYIPDRMARSLRMRKTNTFGFLMNFETDSLSGYIQEILGGVMDALKASLYDLKIISSDWHTSLDSVMRTHGLDGVILPHGYRETFPNLAEESLRYKNKPWPVVVINDYHPSYYLNQLYSDNLQASKILTEYLLDKGYRDFYFIGGEEGSPDAEARKKAFLNTLRDHNVKFEEEKNIANGHFQEQGGYEETMRLFKERPRFHGAIFCANDSMALGTIRAIGESLKRCPEDVAVAGFDGIAMGEFSNPPLTTMKFELYEMGKAAVHILNNVMTGKQDVFTKQKFPSSLLARNSC